MHNNKLPIANTARAVALETISKDTLQNYYLDHTRDEVCSYFNITIGTLQWLLKFYDIKKTTEQKRQTIKNKYDSLENFYNIRNEKSDAHKIERYGSLEKFEKFRTTRRFEGIIDKYGSMDQYVEHMTKASQQTCVEKYGVINVSQLDTVKQKKVESLETHFGSLEGAYNERQKKSNETWINKYGSLENYRVYQQELARQTYIERYGTENPLSSKEIQEKIKNTCMERYGVEYACLANGCRSSGSSNSKPNMEFMKLLEDNDITVDCREFPLGHYIYDFKIGKLLIEINPSATHNSTWSPFGDHTGVSKYYHQLKSKNAFYFGYRCVHVFDWTDRDYLLKNIRNGKYNIDNQKFLEPKLYIYNMKTKTIESLMSDHCVEIYDDGIVIDDWSELL